ncbi:hypothetical protein [Micromonospora sp. CA-111912]
MFDLPSRSGLVAWGSLFDGEELIGLSVFVEEMTGRPSMFPASTS